MSGRKPSTSPVHDHEAMIIAQAAFFTVCEIGRGKPKGLPIRASFETTKFYTLWEAVEEWAKRQAAGRRVLIYAVDREMTPGSGTSREVCVTSDSIEALRRLLWGALGPKNGRVKNTEENTTHVQRVKPKDYNF